MESIMRKWYYPDSVSDNTIENSRSYFLDNLKFILITLVVVGHFSFKLCDIKIIDKLVYFIYIFHMPCFIFTNGLLAKNMNAGGRLRIDKVLSIFSMYLLFKIGNAIIKFIFSGNFALELFHDSSAPWYLISLCIWYLFVPVMERIKPRYFIPGTVLLGLIAGYFNSIKFDFSLSRVLVFFPFFAIGFYLSKEKLEEFLNKRFRLLALSFLIVEFICIAVFWKELSADYGILYGGTPYSEVLGNLAPYGMLFRGIWYGAAILTSAAVMLLVPRCKLFFSELGSRTLPIYMTHVWIRNILVHAGFFVMIKEGPAYLDILVILGSVGLTFLLANKWLKKLFDILMMPKLYRRIFYERNQL
jgi:fucose 4-O-acetylase-like acetyltransferase